jgi:hypothetical protein
VPGFDNPSSFNGIHAQPRRMLKRTTKVNLGKVGIHHSLQKPLPGGRVNQGTFQTKLPSCRAA